MHCGATRATINGPGVNRGHADSVHKEFKYALQATKTSLPPPALNTPMSYCDSKFRNAWGLGSGISTYILV